MPEMGKDKYADWKEVKIAGMRVSDWRNLIGKKVVLNSRPDRYRGYFHRKIGVLREVMRKNISIDGDWTYTTEWDTVQYDDEKSEKESIE